MFLIGFFSASCGWIKNEGLVFFFIFSFFFVIHNFKISKYIKYYFLGTLIPLLVLIVFKLQYAPSNDLIKGQNNSYLKIMDIHRYITILNFLIHHLRIYYQLIIVLIFMSISSWAYYKTFSFQVIISLLIVYFFVYILTPYNIEWHLRTSYDRLILHVTPALLYSIFMFRVNKLKLNE